MRCCNFGRKRNARATSGKHVTLLQRWREAGKTATAMKKTLLMMMLMLGMALGMPAQSTDPDYAAKLESLYKGSVPLAKPKDLALWEAGNPELLLLDTRTSREYEVSHIAGAEFVDYSKFNRAAAADWDRGKPVVVYCSVGYRSERIGEQLKRMGFKTVYNLYGGIFEWVNQGHPVVDAQGQVTTMVHTYNEDWGKWLRKGIKVYQ